MKRNLLVLGGAAALAVAISGCSSVSWENVGYVSPANEINLEANPSIKIVAVGNKAMMDPIVAAITSEFAKSGQFKMDAVTPDYWIILNGERRFRVDDAKTIPFNRTVEKVVQQNDAGGYEYMRTVDHNSSAAAALLSVAVYGVKDLSPIYYFDVAMYDADFKGGNVRGEVDYNKAFDSQIMSKIKDAFLTQKRSIETALPKNADGDMKDAIRKGDVKAVQTRAKQIIPQSFDDFMKDIVAGKYKDNADEMEGKLSNYYILALSQEIGNFEPANLKKLHALHVAILNQTKGDGLAIACPNSLARIESKLKLMQALK